MPEPGNERIAVEGSLFAALRERHPGVGPLLASKATLVATSHLIEDLVARTPGRSVLVSGFQHGRNWAVERDRYLELAGGAEVIAVFAGEPPPASWEVEHVGVRLRATDPLSQEWFVLALGPQVAVTLCGLDHVKGEDGERFPFSASGDESGRLFETIWSFDPEVARAAADVVVAAVERSAPERAAAVRATLAAVAAGDPHGAGDVARNADTVLAGLLERIERLRIRERRVERRANEAKTEFLSRMSHELRTPLNAILGFTQLLELDERSPADAESLGYISRAGRHLLLLINEVLDISRIEAGRLALSLEPVDVPEVVEECVALLAPLAEERRIAVQHESSGAPHVCADRQRLNQIVLNLLSNAVKYTPPHGRVTVRVLPAQDELTRIEVRDTGPGIDHADLGRLFVPFERLQAEGGATEGTGLGLVLSQRMAQAMGGRIEVESRLGGGSAFTVLLPPADPPAGARSEEDAAQRLGPTGADARRRVLYVEDNPSNLRLVERLLAAHSELDLIAARHGQQGVELARAEQPALVLLDLHLPDVAGDAVLARLRADPATAAIPVIVVSADATAGRIERLTRAGAAGFVTKPIDVRILLEEVRRVLGD